MGFPMKTSFAVLFAAGLLAFAPVAARAQTAPHSIIHVITVEWNDGTTPEQIQAALDGAQALPGKYSGITHVWTKDLKVQGSAKNAIVMEFADAAVFKAYTDSPAQKEWYKTYLSIRKKSTTFDITN
jgi:uncharacterized protein (DUF1330 family)